MSSVLASGEPFPTDLLFDPDVVDDRRVIRISEVVDPSITDLEVLAAQRDALALLPAYELRLDAFGPDVAYELKIYDDERRYDLLLEGVRLGELTGARATLSFRRQDNSRWSISLSLDCFPGVNIGPADFRDFAAGRTRLAGAVKLKAARSVVFDVFDGHVRAETPLSIEVDCHLVWHATGKSSFTAFDAAATLTGLIFYWARVEGAQTEFVAISDAQCRPIALGGGTLGPCLELQPALRHGDAAPSTVTFTAGATRKGENPRLEVRLSSKCWSTTIAENGPIIGPLFTSGVVARQRAFSGPYEPGDGVLTSTVAAGIVHNAKKRPPSVVEADPDCPPVDPMPAEPRPPPASLRFASFPSAVGTIEALSAETDSEAADAEANGAERPFWAYAVANAKGKLVLEEVNVSLLLLKLGTALPAATVSNLRFTETAFQLLYRQTGNLQLPASYFWLGAKCLIEGTPRARIDLTRALLKASRSVDLVSLGFRFSDLCLVYDWLAKKPTPFDVEHSIRIEPIPDYCRAIRREGEISYRDTRPLLVVEFPRQHVMEEALFRQELPPLPTRRLKEPEGTFEFPVGGIPRTWPRSPQKLIDEIAGLAPADRAAVRLAWFDKTPPDDAAEDKDFLDFRAKFQAAAKFRPKDEYADEHTKALPVDQQAYIGPFGLEADAMAIGRRILEQDRSGYAGRLVDNIFVEVSDQGRRLIEKGHTPGDNLDSALAFEHLLETSVPAYQLFRDYYRERMIDAVVGEELTTFPKPVDLGAAQIEYFATESVPLPGGESTAWNNRKFLSGSEQDQIELRRKDVLVDYTTALTPNSSEVPEVLRGRLAEPSRLAFRVNCGPASGTMGRLPDAKGREFIAFSLDGLTDWSRHELAVVRRAERLIDPGRDGLLPPRDKRHANIDDRDLLTFQGLNSGKFVTPQQRMGEVVASMRAAPGLWETSIELPARLVLSTAQDAIWRTPRYFAPDVFWRKYGDNAVSAPEIAEDGGNRLARSTPPDGHAATLWAASIDPDADDPGLRVVHSPDFRPEFFLSRGQRLESQQLFGDRNIRLPGNGAPPRGPIAPWLIGREELDTPPVSPDDTEKAYLDANPNITDDGRTFVEACPTDDEPKKFWLSLSKFLHDRKKVTDRQRLARKFRTSLDAYDRHELVILSSAYGLPVLGRRGEDGKLLENSSQFEPPDGFALEGLAPGSAIYQPRTLNLRELTLTAIGGTLRHDTSFLPPASAQTIRNDNLFDALSIERWQHWTVLGRDVFTEVVYKGFLFPLGHRASLVKLTERIFMRASGTTKKGTPNGAVKAYLRQRMYIRVGKPEKDYPAVGQPNGGRQFPVGEVRILTAKTPDIVDPTSLQPTGSQTGVIETALPTGRLPLQGGPGLAFWPRTAMTPDADVVFDVTLDGRLTRLPLIFIDNTAAHDQKSLDEIVEYYNVKIASPDTNAAPKPDGTIAELDAIRRLTHKRTVDLAGQAIRYCDERKEGDSSHETLAWTLKAQGRRSVPQINNEGINKKYSFDPVMEGAEQPPFYPALQTARILLRQTERFTGRPATASVAQFDGHYIGNGFVMKPTSDGPVAEGNASEIYLTLVRPVPMTVGSNGDRTGGMFRPESDFIAISRLRGPIGGSPTPRDEKEGKLEDKKVSESGSLITHVEAYPRVEDVTAGKDKLVAAYKRYFSLDTKLLGLIRLNKLLEYMGLPTPEQGLPLLKEAVDYGIAQAGQALQVVDQASAAGRTAVQGEVIAPLLKVVEQIEADWARAQQQIAAAQPAGFGEPVTLETLFPEIGDGLAALKRALQVSMGTTALVPFFESLAEIHEAGRQLIAGLKRAGSNAAARVDAAIREKIAALTDMVATKLGEAEALLKLVAKELAEDAVDLLVDGLIPPGHDNEPAVSFASFVPAKPQFWPFDPIQGDVDAAWQHLTDAAGAVRITNGEARAFLKSVLLNDEAGIRKFAEAVRKRFKDAEDVLIANTKPIIAGRYEALRALLHPRFDDLDKLAKHPLDKTALERALPAAIRQDVDFVQSGLVHVDKLRTSLEDQDLVGAASALAAIVRSVAGPLGLYDKLDEVKRSVNAVLAPLVEQARKALGASTFCPVGSGAGSDDLCGRLDTLSKTLEQWSAALLERVDGDGNGDIPSTTDFKPLHDSVANLQQELIATRKTVDVLRDGLIADTATMRAVLARLPAEADFDFFKDGEVAALLDDFRLMANGRAAMVNMLAGRATELTAHARKIEGLLKDAGTAIQTLIAEAPLPVQDPMQTFVAAIGSLLMGSAQAALGPTDPARALVNDIKNDLKQLEVDVVRGVAKAYEHALRSLHDVSSAARDVAGTGQVIVDNALGTLDTELSKAVQGVSPGDKTVLPLQTTIRDIRKTIGEMSTKLDSIIDAVDVLTAGDGKIDTNVDTLKELFQQIGWSAKAPTRKLQEVLEVDVPALQQDAAKLERQIGEVAAQSGRSLVGLGKAFVEGRLPPVVDAVLNGFPIGTSRFQGVASIYTDLVATRDEVRKNIQEAGLPDVIKQSVLEAMIAPPLDPVEGDDDQLTIDQKILVGLAKAAAAKPSVVLSDPTNRRQLMAFVSAWEAGSASPLVIAKNVDEVVQDLLRGEWFKLIDVSAIRSEVERYIKNLIPVRARLAYTFGAPMTASAKDATAGIFIPEDGSRLDITVAASVDFNDPQNVKFQAKGTLGRFSIKLVGDLVDAVTINFHGATFTLSGGSGPQLNVMYDDFVIGPALEYVQRLQAMLGPKDGSGFYLQARLNPLGIEAGYGLGLPIITLGNVSFSNISLNAAVVIPFDGSDARFRASLSRRDAPFTIAVAPYGGSGFFAIEANAEGIVGFEASFEFGGAAAFQFGPLSGIGRLMLGVYIKQMMVEIAATDTTPATKRRSTEISATFYVGGAAAIWIFTFGASLYVRLGMKDGNMTGIAIFTFSFSMGIVDYDYSVSVERTENKMGNGQQASIRGETRVAALGNELFLERATRQNEFNSWINNRTKCQGVDWPTYRSYFDRSIKPSDDDLFGDAA